jgi:hypothetical protein
VNSSDANVPSCPVVHVGGPADVVADGVSVVVVGASVVVVVVVVVVGGDEVLVGVVIALVVKVVFAVVEGFGLGLYFSQILPMMIFAKSDG